MKLLSLLPLALLSAFAAAAPSTLPPLSTSNPGPKADLPIPYPEAGLFMPVAAKPITKGHPAWETIVSLDAKGLPLRAVLASAFESAKLQYAVDPGLDLTIYVSVKEVSLREAVAILGKLAEFDVRAEGSVWYASRRKPKPVPPVGARVASVAPLSGAIGGTPVLTTTVRTMVVAKSAKPTPRTVGRPVATGIATQEIEVDPTPRRGAMVPMRVTPPAKAVSPAKIPPVKTARTAFPAGTTGDVPVASGTSETTPATAPTTGRVALNRRVTTKMNRTDLRAVFESFSQQTGVAIVVDDSVPRYKIDSFMKGCSLRYALDRLCAAAGLRYETHGATIRVVKR